jgi:hypothetical protein
MMFRPSHFVVAALALVAAACSDTTNVAPFTAAVRLVNDTDTPIAVTNAGILDTTNARLGFGQASGCMSVEVLNTRGLTVTNAETGEPIAFTPPLTAAGTVIVVAFRGIVGDIQFATLNNRFVPATNNAGLRFFNGVPSAGPLVMQRNGIAITPFVDFGTSSGFGSVPVDSASITFADRFSIVLDAGRMAFGLGQNSTVVVGPPAPPATAPLRFFTVLGC